MFISIWLVGGARLRGIIMVGRGGGGGGMRGCH